MQRTPAHEIERLRYEHALPLQTLAETCHARILATYQALGSLDAIRQVHAVVLVVTSASIVLHGVALQVVAPRMPQTASPEWDRMRETPDTIPLCEEGPSGRSMSFGVASCSGKCG